MSTKEPNIITPFQRVAAMNVAFGNPAGEPGDIDWERIRKQCLNIPDEVGELFIALGCDPTRVKAILYSLKRCMDERLCTTDPLGVRDALCDINVFSNGAHHLMGIDADRDMHSVIDGVMTRFIKDDDDQAATIEKHRALGVTHVYFEGDYPTMIMKSALDQPDAPKGKFLKSASYAEPVFYDPLAEQNLRGFMSVVDTDDYFAFPCADLVTQPEAAQADIGNVVNGHLVLGKPIFADALDLHRTRFGSGFEVDIPKCSLD
jgi:hypothetical protein